MIGLMHQTLENQTRLTLQNHQQLTHALHLDEQDESGGSTLLDHLVFKLDAVEWIANSNSKKLEAVESKMNAKLDAMMVTLHNLMRLQGPLSV